MKNFFLTCKECILENPRNFYGCFYLGPFNSSQSLTVANGLRRTLLSEIPGLGIQSIEIEGIEHEFSTFLGLRESILDLLLNFKEVVLKYNSTDETNKIFKDSFNSKKKFFNSSNCFDLFSKKPIYGYLQARGPGIIRASDLKLPPYIVCVDPNQYIATLTTDGFLNLRFTISESFTNIQNSINGVNTLKNESITEDFSWFKNQKNQDLNLNSEDLLQTSISNNKKSFKNSKILWLDPVFTPILKVNYLIESFGSFELNQENQVILLELWTNGSLHPREAIYKALSELNTMFSKLEKMKILNSIFSKSILNSDKFYSKMLKKVKYNYGYYKSNSLDEKITTSSKQSFELKSSISNSDKRSALLRSFTPSLLLHSLAKQAKGAQRSAQEGERKKEELTTLENSSVSYQNLGIEYLELPFRIKNCLINANLLTINSLLNSRVDNLRKILGMSDQSFIILLKKLNEKGLKLK